MSETEKIKFVENHYKDEIRIPRRRSFFFPQHLFKNDDCVTVEREYDKRVYCLTGRKEYTGNTTIGFSQGIICEYQTWDEQAQSDFLSLLEAIKNKYLYVANTEVTAFRLKMDVYEHLRNYRYDIL